MQISSKKRIAQALYVFGRTIPVTWVDVKIIQRLIVLQITILAAANGTPHASLQSEEIVRSILMNQFAIQCQSIKIVLGRLIAITIAIVVYHSQNAQTMYQEQMVVHQNQVDSKLVKTMQMELPVKMPHSIA